MTQLKNILTFLFLVIFIFAAGIESMAQKENKLIRKGNNAFEDGDFQKAEIDYRKALEKNQESVKGNFNLGGAMYQQESFEEAAKKFESITGEDVPTDIKANSYHNLGNSFMGLQQYDQAIEAYKDALRINPKDEDSRYNLEYARRMLRQQQQQQQQQNQDQNQENEDQKENQDQQNQDQQQQEQDQQKQDQQNQDQQQQNQDQQQQNQDQQQQQQQPQPKQISKEDAERMLQALKDNEKKTLEKIKLEKLKSAKRVKSEKDW
jgi:tetratricopeptide (TPR) repeat protein